MKTTRFLIALIIIDVIASVIVALAFVPSKANAKQVRHGNLFEYLHDYQLEYHLDTIWVYDYDRLVGTHIDTNYQHGQFIDSLIMADNQ